eukprot:GHVQ01009405.1.p1 GENE.GHVQ01009405.1~~GHVQ01009405.1.p1  ORF type:complete len:746 (-),score=201.48 GHVQ01009405.1:1884-3920(-)
MNARDTEDHTSNAHNEGGGDRVRDEEEEKSFWRVLEKVAAAEWLKYCTNLGYPTPRIDERLEEEGGGNTPQVNHHTESDEVDGMRSRWIGEINQLDTEYDWLHVPLQSFTSNHSRLHQLPSSFYAATGSSGGGSSSSSSSASRGSSIASRGGCSGTRGGSAGGTGLGGAKMAIPSLHLASIEPDGALGSADRISQFDDEEEEYEYEDAVSSHDRTTSDEEEEEESGGEEDVRSRDGSYHHVSKSTQRIPLINIPRGRGVGGRRVTRDGGESSGDGSGDGDCSGDASGDGDGSGGVGGGKVNAGRRKIGPVQEMKIDGVVDDDGDVSAHRRRRRKRKGREEDRVGEGDGLTSGGDIGCGGDRKRREDVNGLIMSKVELDRKKQPDDEDAEIVLNVVPEMVNNSNSTKCNPVDTDNHGHVGSADNKSNMNNNIACNKKDSERKTKDYVVVDLLLVEEKDILSLYEYTDLTNPLTMFDSDDLDTCSVFVLVKERKKIYEDIRKQSRKGNEGKTGGKGSVRRCTDRGTADGRGGGGGRGVSRELCERESSVELLEIWIWVGSEFEGPPLPSVVDRVLQDFRCRYSSRSLHSTHHWESGAGGGMTIGVVGRDVEFVSGDEDGGGDGTQTQNRSSSSSSTSSSSSSSPSTSRPSSSSSRRYKCRYHVENEEEESEGFWDNFTNG